MTDRKPAGITPLSWAERQIADAMARGDFAPSERTGKPLDLSDARDPDWWIRRKLRDEEFVALPPAMQLRRDRDDLLAGIDAFPSEQRLREALGRLNDRISYANSHVIPGPPSSLMPLDVDAWVARWRATHPTPPADRAQDATPRHGWTARLAARLREVLRAGRGTQG